MDILLLQIDPALEPSAKTAVGYSGPADATNLGTCFSDVAESRLNHPAVATRASTFSYSWLARAANQVRRYLSSRPQHAAGTRVALQLPNSPEYVAAFYGTLLADCVVVPLPVSLEERRRTQILELAQPDVLISTPADFNAPQEHSTPSTLRLAEKNDARDPLPPPRRQNSDLGMLLFTSGSMGTPKGVMLSHRNLLANAEFNSPRTSNSRGRPDVGRASVLSCIRQLDPSNAYYARRNTSSRSRSGFSIVHC